MIGVREIGDVEAVSLVGGHHRERLVVDIGCDAALGHLLDNFVGLFAGAALKTDQVKNGAKNNDLEPCDSDT